MKKCATCDFWGGDRDITNTGYYVEVDNGEQGACNCNGVSSRLLENKSAVWGCVKWKKWGALK